MNIPPGSNLLIKYQEQNADIIKANIRLNERIAMLESVIFQLQQENIQLRMDKAKKSRRKKNSPLAQIPKKRAQKQQDIPTTDNEPVDEAIVTTRSTKRSCNSKPISYVLPSTKCKLRKGDPHTFGNE